MIELEHFLFGTLLAKWKIFSESGLFCVTFLSPSMQEKIRRNNFLDTLRLTLYQINRRHMTLLISFSCFRFSNFQKYLVSKIKFYDSQLCWLHVFLKFPKFSKLSTPWWRHNDVMMTFSWTDGIRGTNIICAITYTNIIFPGTFKYLPISLD